jgi:RNA polymerase sigma-70 factor (family 1)
MAAYSSFSDTELTDLLKSDDHIAFTEIYERYWKKMLLIAWNHTNDKAHAEDIVHEVFISFWEKRNDIEINSIPAFLTTCIKFSIFKHYQRKQRRGQLALKNYEFSDVTLDEEKLDALFLKEYLDGIVEQLPEKCRLTFKYSRVEGLSNGEIAEKMNITEKGVEANLTRGLKILRSNLKNSGIILLVSTSVLKDLF